jgi:hypothetical protein
LVVVVAVLAGGGGTASAKGPEKKKGPEAKKPPEPKVPTPPPVPAPPPEPKAPEPARDRPPPEQRRMVGILDVRVDGVSDDVKAKFEMQLEQQLDTNQYWLSNRAQMRDRMKFSTKWTEGCLVGECLAEVRTQTRAELVLLAALNGSGTSFGYVVTLVRTDTGRVLAQKSERCDVCTINEAMTEATLATIALLNEIPNALPDDAALGAAAVKTLIDTNKSELAYRRRHRRRVGTALTVAGLAVGIGGAAAAFLVTDHPKWAVGVAAGGAGIAAGGVVVLTF